jgi:diadenosine tetraphosphate (Ap4A) HIT family hydrolase
MEKINSSEKTCPFCNPNRKIILENEVSYAVYDLFPVTEGHTLIIPKVHVASYFDLSENYKTMLWNLTDRLKEILETKFKPDGFNIGINIGTAAGQTVSHVHIHLIPRHSGDTENPAGGARGVIPDKMQY